jgi:uncharacterized protein (DUF433 family)
LSRGGEAAGSDVEEDSMRISKRRIAVVAAGLAIAAGGGVAIAQTTGDSPQERERAVLEDAAGRLGVTADELRDALGAAEDTQLDAAVRAGELTQQQADAIKAWRERSGLVLGGGFGHHGPGFGLHIHHEGPEATMAALDAAAEALGLERDALLERLHDGATLSEIAQDRGVAIADVRAAARDVAKAELDRAVRDGDLTQAQADEALEAIVERIERLGSDRVFGHGPGFGFGFGGAVFEAAAKALGLSEDELIDRLRDGRSLAQIARAQNVPLADVRAAARTAARRELDEAVADGRLTQRQADELLERISEAIERFPAGRRFRFGGFGFHGP